MVKMPIKQENSILKFPKIKCKDHQVTLNKIMVNFNYLKAKTKIGILIICYINQLKMLQKKQALRRKYKI